MRYLSKFQIAPALIDAIRRDPRSLTDLAYTIGLHQSQLSTILNGGTFGAKVREKISKLGQILGVPLDQRTITASEDVRPSRSTISRLERLVSGGGR